MEDKYRWRNFAEEKTPIGITIERRIERAEVVKSKLILPTLGEIYWEDENGNTKTAYMGDKWRYIKLPSEK